MPVAAMVALLIAAPCDVLTRIDLFGSTSASSVVTVAATVVLVALVPVLLLERPAGSGRIPVAFWLFLIWTGICALGMGVSSVGIQNICVYLLFVMIIALTARNREVNVEPYSSVLLAIGWSLAAIYSADLAAHGIGAGDWLGRRSFALEALVVMALSVAARHRGLPTRLLPYVLFVLIALSLSRTATAVAAGLVLVRLAHRRRGRTRLRVAAACVFLAVLGVLAVEHVPLVHERISGGDQARVLGLQINTEGRLKMWKALSPNDSLQLWVGHGPGAAELRIKALVRDQDQPHNDYLRLLYDYGVVGLALFLSGYLSILIRTTRAARRSISIADAAAHTAAALALVAVAAGMATDNVVIYAFAMAPLGLLVGLSLRRPFPPRRVRQNTHSPSRMMSIDSSTNTREVTHLGAVP